MNKRLRAALIAAACGTAVGSAGASGLPDEYIAIDLFGVQHEERIPERDLGFGGRIGAGNVFARGDRGATAIEFGLLANPMEGDAGGNQAGLMIDVVHQLGLGGLTPYIFGGLGGIKEDIGPVNRVFPAFEAGFGLLFDVGRSRTARLGFSAMSVRNDELRADHDAFVDYRLNLGLMFGGAAAAAPAPAPSPARVVDSDGDGLADGQDACPGTPASTADGCPPAAPVFRADTDNDGVGDDQDACPGTLAGLKVDARGCVVETVGGEKQSVVLKGVTFLPGSATLTAEAKTVLDPVADTLLGQKDLEVEIAGHTDAQGAEAANQKLSQRRADSVRQYLIALGVDAARLTAVGYGESQPIADNNTPAGRAENRRVEFKIK